MKNKVCIITGAGGGIGSAIAETLFGLGYKLVLMGRNEEKLKKTAGDRDCLILPGDICDDEYVKYAVAKTVEVYGGIDIVINNAGVAQSQAFEDITMEEYDMIMNTNVRAPFLLCKEALPYLEKTGCGTIINIASVTAHKGYALQSVYSASKHALAGMTKSLANELYSEDIRVHLISPGGVYTEMVKISRPDLSSDGLILPEDIADIAEFFITHRTNSVIDEIETHRANKAPFA